MTRKRAITPPWFASPRTALVALLWAMAIPHAIAAGPMGGYFTDFWTSENGLPDSSVSAIAQTPDGYLWVGTYNGLARFDGDHFVTFDPANTPALCHARVRRLYVDSRGALWILTYDGSLTVLRNGTFALERRNTRASEADLTLVSARLGSISFATSRGGFLRKTLSAPPGDGWEELSLPNRGQGATACEDGKGTIWCRDHDGQLWRLDGPKFQLLPDNAGLAGQKVNVLATDGNGRLWVGTENGLAVWNGAAFQDATPTNGPSPGNVTFLFVTARNNVWAVVDGRLRPAAGRQWLSELPVQSGPNADLSRTVAREDLDGGVWLYNYNAGRGLAHLGIDGQVQELTDHDFAGTQFNCFFEDRERNIWLGLNVGGLARVRETQFQVVESKNTQRGPARSVCEDAEGTIWMGTLAGLQAWRDGQVTNVPLPDRLDSVFCVCPDPSGRLWLSAGNNEDLYVRENGEFRRVAVQGVKAIFAGRDGRVWAGTRSGLYVSEPQGEFHLYRAIPRHYVRALAETQDGALWAGAGNGDLYRVVGEEVTTFHPTDQKGASAIWTLSADNDGTIWAGTFRGGLLRWSKGQFTRFDKEQGLPDNVISQILDDGQGNLWLGSHQGIFRIAKSALDQVARGDIKTLACTVYGRYDGLPSLECSRDYQPAAWRTRAGALWFATVRAVVFTEPSEVRKNLLPPPVVIEDLFVDGKAFEQGAWSPNSAAEDPGNARESRRIAFPAQVKIPPGSRRLEFHFAGLSLAAPDQVRYRYKLEGFDRDWVDGGTERAAQYSVVPPGDYRFHVMACNRDGVWNEAGASLPLRIIPHFYETWWFRVLVGVTVAAAGAGAVRFAATRKLRRELELSERQRAVERERARIAKDIHDDLGASLTLIAVLGDLARRDKAAERLDKMSTTARQAVKSLDEIVWAVNPRNDTLAHLIDYTGQFATDYLRDAGLRCLLDVPEQAPAREVPSSQRHNIFLAVKEALQNIVKHAHATQAWLRFAVTPKSLRIVVEDNGRGFNGAPARPEADGLTNMEQRLKEIGGVCRVRSVIGKGTEIEIELPWPHA